MTTVKIKFPNVQAIFDKVGLGEGGELKYFFTDELKRVAEPYVPMDTGNLKNRTQIINNGTTIKYNSPYARVLYFGEIMVDPETGLAGFMISNDKGVRWASRLGVKKIKASQSGNRPAHLPIHHEFKGSPMRGSQWVHRAFIENEKALIQAMNDKLKRGG